MKTAIYPGSFDPITLGHLNIIRRASGIFDRVVVCIMPNAGKLHPMFTREERVALARRVVSRFPNVEVDTFDGLLAEYAKTLSLIHIPEPTRPLSISYAVFCLKKKTRLLSISHSIFCLKNKR